jgi:transposase
MKKNYITAITKPQIETLLEQGTLQLDLFDETLTEVTEGKIRYILRRNPERARELELTRRDKLKTIQRLIDDKNNYLREHQRAKVEIAVETIKKKIERLKIDSYAMITCKERVIQMQLDQSMLEEKARLDGCYVIKTDLSVSSGNKETVHQCYKDLALVEQAFRTSKTDLLELRPVHVRLEKRTRGHILTVMLAYRLVKTLKEYWRSIEATLKESITALTNLCAVQIDVEEKASRYRIPEPSGLVKQLLEAAKVTLPKTLSKSNTIVTTRKQLKKRRKSL